jgi:hypothetical protein
MYQTTGKTVVIACEVLRAQIESLGATPFSYIYLEQGLHRTPEKLRKQLQDTINECREYTVLLLGYGLCSRAVIGLKIAPYQKMIVPKIDDCIGISLGSRARYYSEFEQNPGTYYFTRGWIETGADPLTEYYETIPKYGEELAKWAARESLKNYRRAIFIKTDNCNLESSRKYVKEFAEFFKLRYEEMEGGLGYLKKLLFGPWDGDFVTADGVQISDEMFESVST